MPKVTYKGADGVHCVDVDDGSSVMQVAIDNMIPGIDGDCGGQAACATCHVYVEEEWLDKLAPIGAAEDGMLQGVMDRRSNSRLGCQIKMDDALDGLVVHMPDAQY